jgi:hypothetical protein
MAQRCMKRKVAAAATLSVALLSLVSFAHAEDSPAAKILRTMSDYVAKQTTISIVYSSDIEVITTDLQKIQFNSSGELLLIRPDKIRATRTGGYSDVQFVFDGKTFTVLDKDHNVFAQADAAGSIDQLAQRLRDDFFIEAPGADLLSSHVYDDLIAGVLEAKHIGQELIDGVECEHLAFRNLDTDWQLWVETGVRPVPRKYVITSKTVAGAPQYTLRIKDWTTDPQSGADTFAFKPQPNAKKVDFAELADIDEVPAGNIVGATK